MIVFTEDKGCIFRSSYTICSFEVAYTNLLLQKTAFISRTKLPTRTSLHTILEYICQRTSFRLYDQYMFTKYALLCINPIEAVPVFVAVLLQPVTQRNAWLGWAESGAVFASVHIVINFSGARVRTSFKVTNTWPIDIWRVHV